MLDKMYKYEMDPIRTLGTTEQTRDAGRMDGRTDRRMEWNQYTPQQLLCVGGICCAGDIIKTYKLSPN